MQIANIKIRPVQSSDRGWIVRLLTEHWGSTQVVSRGKSHQPEHLPGFVALQDGQPMGLLTYRIEGDECEIVTLDSLMEGVGIGRGLIDAARNTALAAGCKRLWLITTNDNLHALRFYQRREFVLAALHANAIEQSRRIKPEIPLIGMDGIPIRDEIELEMQL
jgi:N-acetylglutamate synthase-like GNAT family acetyltransferase